MADIFTKTNIEREEEAMGGKPRAKPPAPAASAPQGDPAGFSWSKQAPADPAKEAAKQQALQKLLRGR
jgi:hypothetical protein